MLMQLRLKHKGDVANDDDAVTDVDDDLSWVTASEQLLQHALVDDLQQREQPQITGAV